MEEEFKKLYFRKLHAGPGWQDDNIEHPELNLGTGDE